MKHLRYLALPIIATLLVLPVSSMAQDKQSTNQWKNRKSRMVYSGSGFSRKRRDTIDAVDTIYTTSATTNGLMFSCIGNYFTVTASVEPQNFQANFNKSTKRRRNRYLDYKIDDGDKMALGVWTYLSSLSALSSQKRSQAAKLYNAVIRRQKVTLYIMGKKPIVLDLPKPNRAFAEFGSACGLGTLAEKK